MNKDAIIDIVSNDLKEMQLLLDNFRGEELIPVAFVELLKTKHNNIGKEIDLLSFWSGDVKPEKSSEVKTAARPELVVEEVKPTIVAEKPVVEPEPVRVVSEPIQPKVEAKTEVNVAPEVAAQPTEVRAKKPAPKASDVTAYGTPVSDIKKAIAIADRFLYQKELFGGNANDFNAAVEIANSMESYDEAERYLVATYGWDIDDAVVVSFLKAVHRRFI